MACQEYDVYITTEYEAKHETTFQFDNLLFIYFVLYILQILMVYVVYSSRIIMFGVTNFENIFCGAYVYKTLFHCVKCASVLFL